MGVLLPTLLLETSNLVSQPMDEIDESVESLNLMTMKNIKRLKEEERMTARVSHGLT